MGHAGTLDPKATGLLILCAGKATKLINQFVLADKDYTGASVSCFSFKSLTLCNPVEPRTPGWTQVGRI